MRQAPGRHKGASPRAWYGFENRGVLMGVSRAEFEKIVKDMQSKGTPLTMPNLLVRTELPRAQIEEWLDAMQRDVRFVPKKKDDPKADAAKKGAPRVSDDNADEGDADEGGGFASLKKELLGEMVKSRLGIGEKSVESTRARRQVRTGGILGLALPPAGLIYSAPIPIAVLGTAAYLALAWFGLKTFVYGGLYIVILLHLAGAVLGAGYAWRFNRKGKRAALVPRESRAKRARGD